MPSIKPSLFANIKRNVFLSTVVILVLFLALILFDPSGFEALTKHLNQWIIDSFSWFYVFSRVISDLTDLYCTLRYGENQTRP